MVVYKPPENVTKTKRPLCSRVASFRRSAHKEADSDVKVISRPSVDSSELVLMI